jgi:hypothetical protein
VIQIESVQIEEFRGIRDLTLAMNRGSFVISGPNGSGKSGVVDAIQFVLTGDVARLRGAGTGDLTLAEHAPHVEKRSDPAAARVMLKVYIPHLKKSASIARTVRKPKHPEWSPLSTPLANTYFLRLFLSFSVKPETYSFTTVSMKCRASSITSLDSSMLQNSP